VLIGLQGWCEQITQALNPLEHHLGCQVSWVNGTGIQFLPGQRRRDRRVVRVSAQRIGCRGVAPQAVLRVVHCHAASPVRRTAGQGNEIGVVRLELLSHGFDPAAHMLKGVARREWNEDVQTASATRFGIPSDSGLLKRIV